jgi:hypothetical protein
MALPNCIAHTTDDGCVTRANRAAPVVAICGAHGTAGAGSFAKPSGVSASLHSHLAKNRPTLAITAAYGVDKQPGLVKLPAPNQAAVAADVPS